MLYYCKIHERAAHITCADTKGCCRLKPASCVLQAAVCKLRLKFRKPAKHTFHPRLQPAPLHSEAGKEAFNRSLQALHSSCPCRACWPHITTSLLGMWSTAEGPSKAPSALRRRLSRSNLQGHRNLGSQRQHFTLPTTRASCGRLHWPTLPLRPRLSTRSPAEQPTSLHLLTTHTNSHSCSQRCSTPRARATFTQPGSSASPHVSQPSSCGMESLAGSSIQLPSASLSGCGMSLSCSQAPHPLLLRCWHFSPPPTPPSPIRPFLPRSHAG